MAINTTYVQSLFRLLTPLVLSIRSDNSTVNGNAITSMLGPYFMLCYDSDTNNNNRDAQKEIHNTFSKVTDAVELYYLSPDEIKSFA